MRVLVNVLSVGHLSGQHVVYGFLRPVFEWTRTEHEFVLLHYEGSPPPNDLELQHVTLEPVPERFRHWLSRTAWESYQIPRLVRRYAADLVFSVSGAITPTCRIPQVSLAQNPWCFIPQARSGTLQHLKARLQQRAYVRAFRQAEMLFFISGYLRRLYESAARGSQPAPDTDADARCQVAYVGLNEDTHQTANRLQTQISKESLLILCVSAMARWKGIETILTALERLHRRGLSAQLRLVGPWPDPAYEAQIRHRIRQSRLDQFVTITGKVSREELHQHYAEAKVFCLMSQCESFGIPAAEAQAFGTPTVATEDCAISEICRGGGLFGPPTDADWTADALERLLTDEADWARYSLVARQNADALRWDKTARPLLSMFTCS